jgi:hypothetical protein
VRVKLAIGGQNMKCAVSWTGAQSRHIRPTTRACSAALLPVCAVPSSLQIFLRSLLISVRERSVMVAAICCKLEAMAESRCVEAGCQKGK